MPFECLRHKLIAIGSQSRLQMSPHDTKMRRHSNIRTSTLSTLNKTKLCEVKKTCLYVAFSCTRTTENSHEGPQVTSAYSNRNTQPSREFKFSPDEIITNYVWVHKRFLVTTSDMTDRKSSTVSELPTRRKNGHKSYLSASISH
jgi:hypothetical protein